MRILGILASCILWSPEVTSHTLFEEGDVMNVLEEFWYGNIEPAEYDASSGKEYKELLQLISRNEDKLLATMTDEQKELFTKYADCVREYQVMAECLLFQNSFRLGVRMMLEVIHLQKFFCHFRTVFEMENQLFICAYRHMIHNCIPQCI